jgi:hypothetical protein
MAEVIAWADRQGISLIAVRAGPPTLEELLLRLTNGVGA